MPEKLTGLRVEDFAHPDDKAAIQALKKVKAVNNLISMIENKSNELYIRMETLGNYVRLEEANAPRLFRILREVCETLDYAPIPELYSYRSYSIEIRVSGVDRPVLIVPDFVLEKFDDDLLRFNFGRNITRLKSGSLKLYTVFRMLITAANFFGPVSDATKLAVANWMRKSELTADRGGLLACQNIRAAMSFLMNKAGMPVSENKTVNYLDYLESYKVESKLAAVGKSVQTLTNCDGWANDRIVELFQWYGSGNFDELIEQYAD